MVRSLNRSNINVIDVCIYMCVCRYVCMPQVQVRLVFLMLLVVLVWSVGGFVCVSHISTHIYTHINTRLVSLLLVGV